MGRFMFLLCLFADGNLTIGQAQNPVRPLASPDAVADLRPHRHPADETSPLSVMKGITYTSVPRPDANVDDIDDEYPDLFMMGDWLKGQWHWEGRNDLGLIRHLGANAVRLRRGDPRYDVREFLDAVNQWGMKAVIDLQHEHADLVRIQDAAGRDSMDLFEHTKQDYTEHLNNGYSLGTGSRRHYHPSIDTIILLKQPEHMYQVEHSDSPYCARSACPRQHYMKAVLSAFDGLVQAEHDAGINSERSTVRLSVPFSYIPCPMCPGFLQLKHEGCCVPCGYEDQIPCADFGEAGRTMRCPKHRRRNYADDCPGIAMMVDLHEAVKNPSSVGYHSKTSAATLFRIYTRRWAHSLDMTDVRHFKERFLDKYERLEFNEGKSATHMFPAFISELKHPYQEEQSFLTDLRYALGHAEDSHSPFIGVSIFEFEVDLSRDCDEDAWDRYRRHDIHTDPCPWRAFGLFTNGDLHVSETGEVPMPGSQDTVRFPVYCLKPANDERVDAIARAFNGTSPDTGICDAGTNEGPDLYCVANRGASEDEVRDGMDRACHELHSASPSIDCRANRPNGCHDVWAKADWAFSIYSAAMGITDDADDVTCNFYSAGDEFSGGDLPPLSGPSAAISSAIPPRMDCAADPNTVPVLPGRTPPSPRPSPPPSPRPSPGPSPGPSPPPSPPPSPAPGRRRYTPRTTTPEPSAASLTSKPRRWPRILLGVAAVSLLLCCYVRRQRRIGEVRMAHLDGLRSASAGHSISSGSRNVELSGSGFAAMH